MIVCVLVSTSIIAQSSSNNAVPCVPVSAQYLGRAARVKPRLPGTILLYRRISQVFSVESKSETATQCTKRKRSE